MFIWPPAIKIEPAVSFVDLCYSVFRMGIKIWNTCKMNLFSFFLLLAYNIHFQLKFELILAVCLSTLSSFFKLSSCFTYVLFCVGVLYLVVLDIICYLIFKPVVFGREIGLKSSIMVTQFPQLCNKKAMKALMFQGFKLVTSN